VQLFRCLCHSKGCPHYQKMWLCNYYCVLCNCYYESDAHLQRG